MRITTGAALPQGADAVVPVEDTLLLREADDVSDPMTSGLFIKFKTFFRAKRNWKFAF